MKKPLNPYRHGVSDYFFGAAALILPRLLNLTPKAIGYYTFSGIGVTSFNALTETSPNVAPVFSIGAHKRYDEINLLLLGAVTAASFIRSDNKTLKFHLAYWAAATTNYLLTDYKKRRS